MTNARTVVLSNISAGEGKVFYINVTSVDPDIYDTLAVRNPGLARGDEVLGVVLIG